MEGTWEQLSLLPPELADPIVSFMGRVYKCKMDLPPYEQALVLVIFGKAKILAHIGPGLDNIEHDGFLQEHFDDEVEVQVTADGLYLWSGKLVEHVKFDEVETWIEGSFTPATQEQWHRFVDGVPPWERSRWLVDEFVRDAVLGACEDDHTKDKHWPPDRFHREEVI